jgi:hypothetical protein
MIIRSITGIILDLINNFKLHTMNNTIEIRTIKKLAKASLLSPHSFHKSLIKTKLQRRIEQIQPSTDLEQHRKKQLLTLINSI